MLNRYAPFQVLSSVEAMNQYGRQRGTYAGCPAEGKGDTYDERTKKAQRFFLQLNHLFLVQERYFNEIQGE